MSSNCHSCGYRDTEIKSGGEIAPQGRKITLQVEDEEDLKRDILKVRSLVHLRSQPVRIMHRATLAASRYPRSTSSSSLAPWVVALRRSKVCSTRSTKSSTSGSLLAATHQYRERRTRWRSSSAS